MIPNLGFGEVGPFFVLLGALLAFAVVGFGVLPWTIARDWPHLRTRSRLTAALLGLGVLAASLAAFAPYEGADGGPCSSALLASGFGLDALATFDGGDDPCAVALQPRPRPRRAGGGTAAASLSGSRN